MPHIVAACSPEAIAHIAGLFREYAAGLGVNLDFQDFDAEVAGLPGRYAPPGGVLFLALAGTQAAGCIALRRLDSACCEMKRLYVRHHFRGRGLGRELALGVIASARAMGYGMMRLDTLPQMSEAQTLYFSLGFREIPPYCFNPVPGSRFLELRL